MDYDDPFAMPPATSEVPSSSLVVPMPPPNTSQVENKPAPIKEEQRPLIDALASTGAGALKGVASIPGMVGDIPQLGLAIGNALDTGIVGATNWLEKRLREEFNMQPLSPEELQTRDKIRNDIEGSLRPYQLATYTAPLTTESLVKKGEDATGYDLYKPKTDIGRYLRAGAEFVPGMFVGPGGFTNMGRKALTGFGAGVGSEAAGTVTEGTPFETAARIAGTIVPTVGIDTAMGIFGGTLSAAGRAKNAEDIAAKVAQERVAKPSVVADAIEAATKRNYIPGLFPTSAQMARSPQLGTLERDVTAQNGLNANAGDISLQHEANKDAFESAANKAANAGAVTMPPGQYFGVRPNPQNVSSRDAFSELNSKWDDAHAVQKANWTDLDNMGASLNKGRMVAGIEDHLNSLSRTGRSEIPAGYKTLLDDIETSYGPQVPIGELLDYRSKILREARDTMVPGNKRLLNEFAEKIRVLMEDQKNFTLGSQQAVGKWQLANRGTSEFHRAWDPVDDMLGVTGNEWKAAPEAAMGKILSGPNSGQNIKKLRDAGVEINPLIEEYMIGQLTQNGNKAFVTVAEINKFRTNPKNATIISEVPNINASLDQLANWANNTSAAEIAAGLNKGFVVAAGTGQPGRIADFISANKQGLQSSGSSQYLDALENSANVLRPFEAGQVASRDVYELLKKGDIITILFGKNMSRAANVGAGAIAGTVAAKVPFFSGLTDFLPGIGALAGTSDKLTRAVSSLIFGATADETTRLLEQAMRDPKVMELLLRRPTPENVSLVMSLAKSMARPAAISSMQAARPERDEDRQPLEVTVRPTNAHGGRTRYAGGGRAKKTVEADAAALINAATKAKKQIDSRTENILNLPDESVVKALRAARATGGRA